MIQKKKKRGRERESIEVEAATVFSFRRRHYRPFLFDLYRVLEGVCLYSYQTMTMKKEKDEERDVPFYTCER